MATETCFLASLSISRCNQNCRSHRNVASIAAEILFNEPTMTSANLFRELSDPVNYLDLILEDPLMSVDAQRGLIGEIDFLLYLIQRCKGIPVRNAINSWKMKHVILIETESHSK